jgi:hypothetical protein
VLSEPQVHSAWNKEELSDHFKGPLLYQFTIMTIKVTAVIIAGYHCHKLVLETIVPVLN